MITLCIIVSLETSVHIMYSFHPARGCTANHKVGQSNLAHKATQEQKGFKVVYYTL